MIENLSSYIEEYRKREWGFIPLEKRGKRPQVPQWTPYITRLPVDAEIAHWKDAWVKDDLNVGIITGAVSRLFVVDFDSTDTYALYQTRFPSLANTGTVVTGKGIHVYYYHQAPGRTVTFTLGGVLNHIKADGSYVVAPPSIHPNGGVYRWVGGLKGIPSIKPVAVSSVVSALNDIGAEFAQSAGESKPINWASGLCQPISEGGRNTSAAQLCGLLINKFPYDPNLIMGLMLAWNNEYCKPPLEGGEIKYLVDTEYRRYGPRF